MAKDVYDDLRMLEPTIVESLPEATKEYRGKVVVVKGAPDKRYACVYNGSNFVWVEINQGIDISQYVTINTNQEITGKKQFQNASTVFGSNILTEDLNLDLITSAGQGQIRFSQGNWLGLRNGGSGTHHLIIDAQGRITLSQQSFVYVKMSANQSLTANSEHVVNFDTVVIDRQGEFNPSTGRWTASVAGIYLMLWQIRLADTSNGALDYLTTLRREDSQLKAVFWGGSGGTSTYHRCTMGGHWMGWMEAGETVHIGAGVWGSDLDIWANETQWMIAKLM